MPDPNTITFWVSIVGAISAIGGGVTVGLFNYLTNKSNNKSEEKKHLQTILLDTAMEHYKQVCLLAQGEVERGHKSAIPPLDGFIINMLKLSELFNGKEITPERVSKIIKEAQVTLGAADDAIKKFDAKK